MISFDEFLKQDEADILYHLEKIEKMLFMLLNEEQRKQINEEDIQHLKEKLLEVKRRKIEADYRAKLLSVGFKGSDKE